MEPTGYRPDPLPIIFAPFARNTPTTLNATFRIRISLPIGDSSPNNCLAIVRPIMQTLFSIAYIMLGERFTIFQVSPVPNV